MELVYLWVEDYKNIKRQGFNFSPNYDVEFKPVYENAKLIESSKLIIEKKNNSLHNFFGKNINITAIVGENGSGKSTLLEIINENYFKENTKLFFIYKKIEKEEPIKFFYCKYNLAEKIQSNLNLDNSINLNDMHYSSSNEIDTLSIYYSNTITELGTNLFDRNFYDRIIEKNGISLSHELNNTKLYKDKFLKDYFISKSGFRTIFNTYQINQKIKSIIFIKESKINFKFFPKKIFINNISNNPNLDKLLTLVNDKDKHFIKERFGFSKKQDKSINLIRNIVVNILVEINDNSQLFFGIKSRNYFFDLLNSFNDKLSDFISKLESLKEKCRDYNDESNNFVKNIKSFSVICTKFFSSTNNELTWEINIKDFDINILNFYNKITKSIDKFLSFSWEKSLSGGEENLLYQFARIYSNCENTLKKNIDILLDEGENTLHPSWQREYIKKYIDFSNLLIEKIDRLEKINIIVCTHSPFVLSDIPKENIIFLEEGKQVYPFENRQTFGANIHTLLSHGFFMKDGLMGEFAKSKIDKAIEYLNQKVLTKDEIEYCENIISIIGEPIIKRQLQKMLDSKRLSEIDVIKKQIEELQKELATKENKK